MDIRPPTQSLFLSGESPEVDNLVKRARPVDGPDPRSRALVPQAVPSNESSTAPSGALYVSETPIDYEALAAHSAPRVRTATDLYQQVYNASKPEGNTRFLDVFV